MPTEIKVTPMHDMVVLEPIDTAPTMPAGDDEPYREEARMGVVRSKGPQAGAIKVGAVAITQPWAGTMVKVQGTDLMFVRYEQIIATLDPS